MKIRILITGSNGLLGQKLVKLSHDFDDIYDVTPTGNGPSRINPEFSGNYRSLDISDQNQVDELFEDVKPHFVINAAAMTNVDLCETEKILCDRININGVKNLKEACDRLKSHLIHVSTDFIFDGMKEGYYSEEDNPNPLSYYGKSKLESEQILINSNNDNWTILRTVLVYGVIPNSSRSNIVLWVKNSLEKGTKINVVDDQYRMPTLAEDLAAACLLCVQKKAKGIFNISGKDYMNMYDLAMKVASFFKSDTSLISRTSSDKFKQAAKRPPKTGFILDKAINELNYKPTSFEKGLELVKTQLS